MGEVIDLGATRVSKEMIVTFAREFDPFPFHLDEEAGRKSLFGGLAAFLFLSLVLALVIESRSVLMLSVR